METPLYAKIQHLKFGNLHMVTYAINMSDLANIKVVMMHGIGAMVKNVEKFAKRHVMNANILQIQYFHTFPTLTYKS